MSKLGPYELNSIVTGDARELAKALPDNSIHCICCSPPYWGLRDYGVTDQIGLEETPEQYIQTMVELFRELRRALREDGTLWLNLGDCYFGSWGNYGDAGGGQRDKQTERFDRRAYEDKTEWRPPTSLPHSNLKPKDLVGIPWRIALALQADGWWLRSDIIWSKPNPMPESVTDRPTKAHEYIFLLTKSARYWYDAEAVRELALQPVGEPKLTGQKKRAGAKAGDRYQSDLRSSYLGTNQGRATRNLRTVWEVPTVPFPGSHFAVFPPKLIEPCILAGCPSKVCAECGAPWERVVEKSSLVPWSERAKQGARRNDLVVGSNAQHGIQTSHTLGNQSKTTGHRPTCQCNAGTTKGITLDPFIGSGTTAYVAIETGRDWLGFDLNEKYVQMAYERIAAARVPIPGLEPGGDNGRQPQQAALFDVT